MILRLYPGTLRGSVRLPDSKSALHRQLICACLSGADEPALRELCDDIRRTRSALRVLREGGSVVDCGASGTTLRLMLPVFMALDRTNVTFTGTPRLLQRPLPASLPMARTALGWRITGALMPGTYALSGQETSQLISGFLLALPLLDAPSRIDLTAPCVSAGYIGMTLSALHQSGITVERTAHGFAVPAPQRYRLPRIATAEGDWSAGAWFLAVNALGRGAVDVQGLYPDTCQPDAAILRYCKDLPAEVDVSATPDLLPTLALLASAGGRSVRFTHGAFLRGKESDRLAAVTATLLRLGVAAYETEDGLVIEGGHLKGGVTVDSCGDHRIAMLCAFAALFCTSPVTLRGAECVEKSYAAFWRDYAALGGRVEVVPC